jgi:polar amino acid transport system substrate-binding protein
VLEYPLRSRIGRLAACLLLITPFLGAGQAAAEPAGTEPAARVPGFWDPRRRPEKPDLTRISVIRFLTETDYPPFNYAGPDGNPQGFNVDLALPPNRIRRNRRADPWLAGLPATSSSAW